MKLLYRIISVPLICILSIHLMPLALAAEETKGESHTQADSRQDDVGNLSLDDQVKRMEKGAVAVADKYKSIATERKLNTTEYADWALAEFVQKHCDVSLSLAFVALGTTQEAKERSVLYLLIAQDLGAQGKYEEAGRAALEGQRLDPSSKDLAATRIAYFTTSGDGVQALAAQDHLMALEHSYSSRPVCDPITLGVVIVVSVGVSFLALCAATTYMVKTACEVNPDCCKAAINVAAGLGSAFRAAFGGVIAAYTTAGKNTLR